jgi:hypothetical protein
MPHHPARNQSLGGSIPRIFATLEASTLLRRNWCGIKVRKVAAQVISAAFFVGVKVGGSVVLCNRFSAGLSVKR